METFFLTKKMGSQDNNATVNEYLKRGYCYVLASLEPVEQKREHDQYPINRAFLHHILNQSSSLSLNSKIYISRKESDITIQRFGDVKDG